MAPKRNPNPDYVDPAGFITKLSEKMQDNGVYVADVGQNQMMGARYSRFTRKRSFISSGGLGTMGFGIPAAIGAKMAAPDRQVCLFVGDGGYQMTLQEFGTIMQEGTGVKIVLLNNNWLGNVRQWQELFFGERYSQTRMVNPDFSLIAKAYGIKARSVEKREDLEDAVREMLSDDSPFILEVHVQENGMVMPMVPPGKGINQIMLSDKEWFENV